MSWGDYLKEGTLWQRKTAQVIDQIASIFGGTATGSTNAYVLNTTTVNGIPAPVRLVDGELVRFIPSSSNTGAVTISISQNIATKSINAANGTTALTGGEIVSDTPTVIQYDSGLDCFRLLLSGDRGGSFNWTTSEQVWPYEKLNGDVIYAKMYIVAAMPNNTTLNIAHGITTIDKLLFLSAAAGNGSSNFISDNVSNAAFRGDVIGTNIRVISTVNFTGYSGVVRILYTKQ